MLVHQGCAVGHVGGHGAEPAIVHPAFSAPAIELKVGIEERTQGALNGRLSSAGLVVGIQRRHPQFARHLRAAGEHGIEQLLLVGEVIVHQRVVDAHALGHILHRHAIEAVLRKQVLGRVEDLLHHFRALLGFFRALGLCWRRNSHGVLQMCPLRFAPDF